MLSSTIIYGVIAFAEVALAVPTTPGTSPYSLEQLARFENADIPPVLAAKPVGIYLDLMYNAFSGIAPVTPPLTGVRANTPNNQIAYTPLGVGGLTQGQPSFTTNYPDSTVDYIQLKSFYFGCVLNTRNAEDSLPVSCTVTAECISPAGKPVGKAQTFPFVYGGPLKDGVLVNQVQAKPIGFTQCQTVKLSVQSSAGALNTLVIDTVNYVVFGKKPLGPN